MNVEIFSDVVCPWCYLGRARFAAAAREFGGEVNVTWRPYQLDPGASGGGLMNDSLAEKFGGADRVAEAHARMRELMAAEGLPYAPEKALSANTRDAHRVIALAGEAGVQDAVVGRLFRAHHAEGRDLNDHGTLAELAAEAGMSGVAERLAAGEGDAAVGAQLEVARTIGVTGVPFFVFEGTWAVSGAQSREFFGNALAEVAAKAG
ncbi:DsbA family oxidoreductase [Actinoallomurus rhizosphaericola]|uniref:DsbA family oxidoreductase n=1 Tax=Actinoallomurus rhizosphaericola TaxID=2952536 RepID=UPI002092E2A0|nr:DsbA family oxidoreductase [Actinoallomurus rhizosphaericola]MCO5996622.1 DsbA family oxidoreductase [Actinoallomurus rhizosphaericola]